MDEHAAATNLAARLEEVWPQLSRFRITHSWRGKVAMTFDKVAHMGEDQGVHFAMGCNGNGVALMTYLGHQTALKLLGKVNKRSAFDAPDFPTEPYYGGRPWFLPIVSAWYHLRDGIDRKLS